jgi:O-antigen ligase
MQDVSDPPPPRRARSPADGRLTQAAELALLGTLLVAPWLHGGAPEPVRYGLAAVVLAALALGAAAQTRGTLEPPLLPAALGLPAWAFVQALTGASSSPRATLDAALLLTAGLGTSVLWARRARGPHRTGRRLAAVILTVALAQGVFGAVQQALTPGRIYGATTALLTMPFGSYVNHNHFAGLAAMATLLAAGLAWGHARRAGEPTPVSIGLGGLALALAATLFASRSRGGLLALGAGLAALLALRALEAGWREQRAGLPGLAWGAGVMLATGLGAAFLLVPGETRAHLLGTFTGAGAADTSSQYRLDTAAATLRLFASRPLVGSGFGAYADAVTPHKRAHGEVRTTHAESDLLEAAAEGGLVGLALLVWLLASAWRGLRERLRHGHDALHNGLVAGAASALCALAVHSLFDFNLRLPANALVASSLLGLVAAGRAPAAREEPGVSTGPGRRGLRLGAAFLLALLAAGVGWRALGAGRLERASALPAAQRLGALERVVAAHPWSPEAWRARGLAWRDQRRTRHPTSAGPRLARAERDLTRALELRPGWADAWAERGWVRLLRGDVTGARADVERAVELDPTQVGLTLTRAEVHALSGDRDAAVQQLARLLAEQPTWAAAVLRAAVRWGATPEQLDLLVAGDPARAALRSQAQEGRAALPPAR